MGNLFEMRFSKRDRYVLEKLAGLQRVNLVGWNNPQGDPGYWYCQYQKSNSKNQNEKVKQKNVI